MQKAFHLNEIDQAVNKFEPVTPDHPFYTDFEGVRSSFQQREVFRILNVEEKDSHYIFNADINRVNKTFLFLAGMRGSGKTSELAKFAQLLEDPECFFVVTCNIDKELDLDKVQYMDILIFQLEKLIKKANDVHLEVKEDVLRSMQRWFEERVKEINRTLKAEGQAEMEVGLKEGSLTGSLLKALLGITGKLKAGLTGSTERAERIRENLKNSFSDYAPKFNEFIEQVNEQLRKQGIAREILFIVDGLEKTFTAEVRRKLILEESNRILKIRANTIFTLPVELIKEEAVIRRFSEVVTFPFVKIRDRNKKIIEEAVSRFEEFVYKRIDAQLFDSPDTVRKAIFYSGGSPLQLLRILEMANWNVSPGATQIDSGAMDKSIERLANQTARFIEPEEFELLKNLHADLEAGKKIGFSKDLQVLLEKGYVFEYNDGGYKCVNPLVETSDYYRQNVLDE